MGRDSIEERSVSSVEVAGLTDQGRVRKNNEDSFLIADLSRQKPEPGSLSKASLRVQGGGLLLAVADGMGGEKAGERASAIALEALLRSIGEAPSTVAAEDALRSAVEQANREVQAASQEPDCEGMGATLTACLFRDGAVDIAEVGDSRAYLLRDGRLQQLTKDQSFVQLLIDTQGLTEQEARASGYRNVILQAIGKTVDLQVGMSRLELQRGDRLLLCTDGLTAMTEDADIQQILLENAALDTACSRLVASANEHGGRDNITVILAGVGRDGDGGPEPSA